MMRTECCSCSEVLFFEHSWLFFIVLLFPFQTSEGLDGSCWVIPCWYSDMKWKQKQHGDHLRWHWTSCSLVERWSPPLLLFGSLTSHSGWCCRVDCSPIVRWIITHNQNCNWTCLLDGGGEGVWQTDEKQTAAGKTQHCDDLITFFRTSSTITWQLLPPFNGHVVKWNISCIQVYYMETSS